MCNCGLTSYSRISLNLRFLLGFTLLCHRCTGHPGGARLWDIWEHPKFNVYHFITKNSTLGVLNLTVYIYIHIYIHTQIYARNIWSLNRLWRNYRTLFGISLWKNPSCISTFFWMSCDSRVHSSMCQSSPWVTSLVVGFQFPVVKFFPFPRLSQSTSWIHILRVFSGSSDAVAPANNLYIAVYWESKSSRRFLKKWKFIGSLMKPVMEATFCSCSCFFLVPLLSNVFVEGCSL